MTSVTIISERTIDQRKVLFFFTSKIVFNALSMHEKTWKESSPVEHDAERADLFEGNKVAKLFRDPSRDIGEKINESRIKKFVEPAVMAEDVSEYGYQEEAEGHERHHKKIGKGAGKHEAAVFEEIYKTLCKDFWIFHVLLVLSRSFKYIRIGVPRKEKPFLRTFSICLRCASLIAEG